MTLPYPIAPGQYDAKSPVDDNLMSSLVLNQQYLDQSLTQGGAPVYCWNVNGDLSLLPNGVAKRIDMQFLHVLQQFSTVRVAQNAGGTSGKTEIDIRYHSNPKTPISAITPQMVLATQSISRISPNTATQSIARAADPVATQTITRAKAQLNIQSIISMGSNIWRYNTNTALDADYLVNDPILLAGCIAGGNNGAFIILEVNPGGSPGFTLTNASGVTQTSPAGTVDLQCFSYNLVDPASAQFVPGEFVNFSTHTSGANDGTKTIYKVNEAGNNIWVKHPIGTTQAAPAGTVNCLRWRYTFSAPADNTLFFVGESANFTGHTSGGNNGTFPITGVNVAGNNLIVYNTSGVAQGGVVGVANTCRFKFTFLSNPSPDINIGDKVTMAGHTGSAYSGVVWTLVMVNYNTSDNIVIHAPAGVTQAGVAGTVTSVKKLIKFFADQSLIYSTNSYVEIEGTADTNYKMLSTKLPYKVIQVNRGGGANYNIVIEESAGGTQISPAGYVAIEAKSLFNLADGSKPQVSADLLGISPNGLLKAQYISTIFTATPVPANTYLGLYILQIQGGKPRDLSVMLT